VGELSGGKGKEARAKGERRNTAGVQGKASAREEEESSSARKGTGGHITREKKKREKRIDRPHRGAEVLQQGEGVVLYQKDQRPVSLQRRGQEKREKGWDASYFWKFLSRREKLFQPRSEGRGR